MRNHVVVLGGGVGGMSAAHELVERGFTVDVFERREVPGGKARSMGVPGTGKGGRPDLPGEHGFRFFPGFYKHLPDTMKRIPFAGNAHGVFDNLVTSTRFLLAREGDDAELVARFPTSIEEFVVALKDIFSANLGIGDEDLLYFAERIFIILTSCPERRLSEYEKIPWWDFIGAGKRSKAYQEYLAEGLTRSLVAMRAEVGSTRTVGDILIQLMFNTLTPGVGMDRLLNGPSNDAWLTPWRTYLIGRGVTFHFDTEVTGLTCSGHELTSATVKDASGTREVRGDFFISAMPVEVFRELLTPELERADPGFAQLTHLDVEWMNGIQFYLREDVPVVHGHAIFVDTPYALTSISQAQFWRTPLSSFGDGTVNGLLSVDISDWEARGIIYPKPAKELTADEVKEEVWAQLKRSLHDNPHGSKLTDANLAGWHLDPDVRFSSGHPTVNLEPLLVNLADSWRYRPDAATKVKNLFLASDYVRTNTDLACMEGANEAARRAVNGVLERAGSAAARCQLWPLQEPAIFAPAQAFDWVLWKLGLPHAGLKLTSLGAKLAKPFIGK